MPVFLEQLDSWLHISVATRLLDHHVHLDIGGQPRSAETG